MASKLALTVSQLNEYVRRLFQMDPMLRAIELQGEISNLKFHQSGALFFTMKDELSAISCVMFAQDVQGLQAEPFDGMRAVVSGSVGLYARTGQYRFTAKALRAQGVGVLYERLQALKAQLEREGLFAPQRKRALPACPRVIGVVTSPTGAVIRDILNVSLRRNPCAHILLCPVRVQGIGAQEEVASAIALLGKMPDVDVVIVARGGGSIEDLWTFNEERVVRAVAACGKPVVSAVGHETDVTLCDLAADLRAPTPSAAAECVVPVREELLGRIAALKCALGDGVRGALDRGAAALALAAARLAAQRPDERLARERRQLEQTRAQLVREARLSLERAAQTLGQQKRELELLSPYRVLARGYAIVQRENGAIACAGALCEGETVSLRFADGGAEARITTIALSGGEDGHGGEEKKSAHV